MKVAGRAFIIIGGTRLRSLPGSTLDMGGVSLTPMISDSGMDGCYETYSAPKVNCKIHFTQLTDLDVIKKFIGNLAFETDIGRAFTLIDARLSKPITLEKGVLDLEFVASHCFPM